MKKNTKLNIKCSTEQKAKIKAISESKGKDMTCFVLETCLGSDKLEIIDRKLDLILKNLKIKI